MDGWHPLWVQVSPLEREGLAQVVSDVPLLWQAAVSTELTAVQVSVVRG